MSECLNDEKSCATPISTTLHNDYLTRPSIEYNQRLLAESLAVVLGVEQEGEPA